MELNLEELNELSKEYSFSGAQAKSWSKLMLHSCFGNLVPFIPMEYDKNMVLKITEEGQQNIKLINDFLKEHDLPEIYTNNTDNI